MNNIISIDQAIRYIILTRDGCELGNELGCDDGSDEGLVDGWELGMVDNDGLWEGWLDG